MPWLWFTNHCWTPSRMVTSFWQWLKKWFHRQAAKIIFLRRVAGLTLCDRVSELSDLGGPWYQAAALRNWKGASWVRVNSKDAPWLPPSGGVLGKTICNSPMEWECLGISQEDLEEVANETKKIVCSAHTFATAFMTTIDNWKKDGWIDSFTC